MRSLPEFGRQLALGLRPVHGSPPVKARIARDGDWVLVVLPGQLEDTVPVASVERLGELFDAFHSAGYRAATLTVGTPPPAILARSDKVIDARLDAAAGNGSARHPLADNASLRWAGTLTGQELRPLFVLQCSGPFLNAGVDIAYYCNAPLVLYWWLSTQDQRRPDNRFRCVVKSPLAWVAQSMDRIVVARSAVVVTHSSVDRDAVVDLVAEQDQIVVLDAADSRPPELWVSAIRRGLDQASVTPVSTLAGSGSTREDVNGHGKRVRWIASQLEQTDRAVEFGCGTGVMVTIPLVDSGYDVRGVDLDHESIELGRKLLLERGLDPDRLVECDLRFLPNPPNVIIASEVLEHIPDDQLDSVVGLLYRTLPPNGRLLVTVPNGYGWFELESALWFRLGIGRALGKLGVIRAIKGVKQLFGVLPSNSPPSTLADSPHVQRFTQRSIVRVLLRHGFRVDDIQGSVLWCGPFTGLLMEGFRFFPKLNARAGKAAGALAAGFYVACTKPRQ